MSVRAQGTAQALAPEQRQAAQQALNDRIDKLIEQLSATNFQERSNAQWELERIGLSAFEKLRVAAERHPNIETANAARYILKSQQVSWYLETDSAEVREILSEYQNLSESERLARIALLVRLHTPDSLLALCRIARFERERPAKTAALGIIEILTEPENAEDEILIQSLLSNLGSGSRTSVDWIRQAISDVQNEVDVQAWKRFAETEINLPRPSGDLGETQQLLLSLCTRISLWINTRAGNNEAAIEFARPHLNLVRDSSYELQRFSRTLLDRLKAPRLVTYLEQVHPEKFAADPMLLFLLAESHLKLNATDQATAYAKMASDLIGNPAEYIKSMTIKNNLQEEELVASNRFEYAKRLENRGMFEWAQVEYEKSLEFESRHYKQVRIDFAEFLWSGGQHRQAAECLRPVVQKLLDTDEVAEKINSADLVRFYYYDGLALSDEGKRNEAWDALLASYELIETTKVQNQATLLLPDIVIAMNEVASANSESQTKFDQIIEKTVRQMRGDVIAAERALGRAPNREDRRREESRLASACNQLAWLLGKCVLYPQEAVTLSERAVELIPEDFAFQDTLGRAYLSNNEYDKALSAQKRAVELMPSDRQLLRQLAEIEKAIESSK